MPLLAPLPNMKDTSQRNTIKNTVNIIISNGGDVLLSRRANTGWRDNDLCIVGGHVEKGETPTQAAIRELKEEVGLDTTTDSLTFVTVAAREGKNYECVAYVFLYVLNLRHGA